ncbi:LPS translocon maturation chaperone LptM [Pseudoalteromonas sp. T1lg65]|uniref:LPS translocon maturation chaperone LptM n=1 Tax=Pseudoalteromonas sp. T1lg65 TaxID=2077101 RepID=UPI003F78F3FF
MKATSYKISLLIVLFATTLSLSGCGQSGPLYLPEKQQQNQPKPETEKTKQTTKKSTTSSSLEPSNGSL